MIYNFLTDYLSIIIFLFIALLISIGFILINFISSPTILILKNFQLMSVDLMRLTTLEWNLMFDFILVAILFIIFDLEIAFLFPWAITLGEIGVFGFWSMMIFLAVLTIGFIYEWKKGALEWE